MFIQTEVQPDADQLRFMPGRTVLASGAITFEDADQAERSPLARRIFGVAGVSAVTLESQAILLRKDGAADWALIKPAVLGLIMEHFVSGDVILMEESSPDDGATVGEDSDIANELRDLIETRIRPAVKPTGGEVRFRGFDEGYVHLEMEGSAFSFRPRIEAMLKHYVPEVEGVRDYIDMAKFPGLATPEGIEVRRVLDEEINPSVASHGGHISLVDVQGERVYIRLEGGCQGCGMADVTLKQGVEVGIRRAVPSIREVLDVTEHAEGSNPYFQAGKGGGDSVY